MQRHLEKESIRREQTPLDVALREPFDWTQETLTLGILHLPEPAKLREMIDQDKPHGFRDTTARLWTTQVRSVGHNNTPALYVAMTTQFGEEELFTWGLITDPKAENIRGVYWVYDRFPTFYFIPQMLPQEINFAKARRTFNVQNST